MRAILMSLVLLAACAPQENPDGPETQPAAPQTSDQASAEDTCGMAAFQHLIGTPAAEIDPSALPPRTRILTPTSIMTQDFSPQRLNILTDADGRVSSLRCF